MLSKSKRRPYNKGCRYWYDCLHCGFEKCIYDKGAYLPTLWRVFMDELVEYLYKKGATPHCMHRTIRWSKRSIRRSIQRYFEAIRGGKK